MRFFYHLGAMVMVCALEASADDNVREDPLSVTITPMLSATYERGFEDAYMPLSDGALVDFSTWMSIKYGLGPWRGTRVAQDQLTGRTALTVYGLGALPPLPRDEDAYVRPLEPISCGLFGKVILGQGRCDVSWQSRAETMLISAYDAPQMSGLADFNSLAAITPVDQELGRLRFGPPVPVLSLVP